MTRQPLLLGVGGLAPQLPSLYPYASFPHTSRRHKGRRTEAGAAVSVRLRPAHPQRFLYAVRQVPVRDHSEDVGTTALKRPPSKLWKCVCGECDPNVLNLALRNCGGCGYLALSSTAEDTDEGVVTHRCPVCGEQWWLFHETWSRMHGHWVAR